jgi:uncharacterized membrane protein
MATEDDGGLREKVADVAGGDGNALSALKSKEILIPAAVTAASALAASKGPGLLRKLSGQGEQEAEKLGERAAEGAKESIMGGGGGGGLAGKALKKAIGKGGGGGGGKKTRRLPIQRWTDVAVPVDQAYEAWTKFDQYPRFMHRVLSVEQKGDDRVSWQEKIWFSKRQWEGRITERRKNELIAWKTTNGVQHKGVVSFHRLDDRLTRVMVDMEFEPTGLFEKMASGLRFVKRAVQADLARFKAYVELGEVKGIDYRPNDQKDDEDEQGGKNEKNDKSEKDADEPQSRERSEQEEKDEAEREAEREEREKRRQERRGKTTAD